MKRWLLPANALVLVLIACGAGGTSAPRVAEARTQPASVRVIAARREHAALREATELLGTLVLPRGARRIPEPRNEGGVLRRSGPGPLGELADAHGFWSVHEPLKTVIAFLRTHRAPGFEHFTASWGSGKTHYLTMSSSSGKRSLNVTSVALSARTVIRADAQVEWTYPRSPREKVPAATSEIDVRAPKVSAKVTDRGQVAQIIRWFDALPISPPGIAVSCPAVGFVDVTLTFRNAHGNPLAQAYVPPSFAWICDPIAFSIGGKQQKPLVDRPHQPSFVRRLQGLLGVRLIHTHR